ncbi:MAG: c-type cytochrome [Actinobacteria bacterium]|nr:c-type cytochrome [Thermoleophilia bacterium]MCB9011839.1 c-type cytochrome [Actinomycetota bacterium]
MPSSDTTASATVDAKDLFVNGKASTGAVACGNCHALKAAGTTGTAGPNLDEIAPDDDAAVLAEMITDPNAEIVAGYQKDIMPQDYGTSLTADEVQALATYIDENSDHAE